MSVLNYEFFDEFKKLDNLCRDIYGPSAENKLGVTQYLEDMKEHSSQGEAFIYGWNSDYMKLKNARNIRNEIAHSRNTLDLDICTAEDIAFVREFRAEILRQADPLSLLAKRAQPDRSSRKHDVTSLYEFTLDPVKDWSPSDIEPADDADDIREMLFSWSVPITVTVAIVCAIVLCCIVFVK